MIGIASASQKEERRGIACSASQFEKAVAGKDRPRERRNLLHYLKLVSFQLHQLGLSAWIRKSSQAEATTWERELPGVSFMAVNLPTKTFKMFDSPKVSSLIRYLEVPAIL